MIPIIINISIGLSILIIGISLAWDSRKKHGHTSKVEFSCGVFAVAAGCFYLALVTGTNTLQYLKRLNQKRLITRPAPSPVIIQETALEKRIKYMQKYVPPENLANADPRFTTYDGTASNPRLPLVFPYEIRWKPDDKLGTLAKHLGEAPVDELRSVKPLLKGLEKANYNNRILVGKLITPKNGNDGGQYILFNFKTEVISRYETEEQMWKAAKDTNFDGKTELYLLQQLRENYFQDSSDSI